MLSDLSLLVLRNFAHLGRPELARALRHQDIHGVVNLHVRILVDLRYNMIWQCAIELIQYNQIDYWSAIVMYAAITSILSRLTSALVFITSATTKLTLSWLSPMALKSEDARI